MRLMLGLDYFAYNCKKTKCCCRDLLGKDVKRKLDLKEHPDKGVYVHDISIHSVHNTQVLSNLAIK